MSYDEQRISDLIDGGLIINSELYNRTIYISGKITGLDIDNAASIFKEAEQNLKSEFKNVINPMELVPYDDKLTWHDYMVKDIEALLKCDAIFMLKNWGQSKGARVERAIAIELGLEIIYQ